MEVIERETERKPRTSDHGHIRPSERPPEDAVVDLAEGLAAVLRLVGEVRRRASGVALDDLEVESGLRATEAVRRAVDAMELALVAELNRHGERRGDDGIHRDVRLAVDQVAEMAPDALALAVGVGPTEADRRCALATRSVTDLAPLAELMAEGRMSRRSMEQVHQHTRDATGETTQGVLDHLLGARRGRPGSIRITDMEPHEVAKTCRRLVARLDPDLVAARAAANRATRLDVRTDPGPIGTSWLTGVLPTELGAAVQAAVDEAGRWRRVEDPDLPIGSARALGLADLVLCGSEVTAEVRLGIPVIASAASRLTFAPARPCGHDRDDPLEQLLGDGVTCERSTTEHLRIVTGDGPDAVDVLAEEWMSSEVSTQMRAGSIDDAPWVSGTTIPGVGFVPPDVVAAIATQLDTRVGRALLDARTGTLLETTTSRHAIPRGQRDFVATRDGTCRMWGCYRPVTSTRLGWAADIDHATPWPEGETTPGNLSALCRHHHRVKHSPRWTHRLRPDGSTEWVTPGGTVGFTFPDHAIDGDGAEDSSPPTGTNDDAGRTDAVSSPPTGTNETAEVPF